MAYFGDSIFDVLCVYPLLLCNSSCLRSYEFDLVITGCAGLSVRGMMHVFVCIALEVGSRLGMGPPLSCSVQHSSPKLSPCFVEPLLWLLADIHLVAYASSSDGGGHKKLCACLCCSCCCGGLSWLLEMMIL